MNRIHEERIELIRKKMIQSGIQRGLDDKKTVRLSEQLDEILNKYETRAYNRKDTINFNENFFQ